MCVIKSMKNKMVMKSKISSVFFGAYLFLVVLSLFMGGLWLINTQVAFICSMIIILASFFSYKGMIEKRLERGEIGDDRELLDTIDDKYGLYDSDEEIKDKELSKEEFAKLYKEQRAKNRGMKQTFTNLFKSGRGLFNPIRLLSYALLCVAILFLIRHELFSAIPFLVGVGAVPLASIAIGFFIDK